MPTIKPQRGSATSPTTPWPEALPRLLRVDRPFGVIDGVLVVNATLAAYSKEPMPHLLLTFSLLTLGAFYWRFVGFAARTSLWVFLGAIQVFSSVGEGHASRGDLYEIPLLLLMLILVFLLVAQRNRVQDELAHRSLHDDLTQLANRTQFLRRLDAALERASRTNEAVAVLCLDLDGFKDVNDRHGHGVGDQLLVAIAARLRAAVRATDTIARLGGDEFMVLLESDPGAIPRIAERIVSTISEPFHVDGIELSVTTSVGIALADNPSPAMRDDLVRHADAAMYRVKAAGKAGYELFSPAPAIAA